MPMFKCYDGQWINLSLVTNVRMVENNEDKVFICFVGGSSTAIPASCKKSLEDDLYYLRLQKIIPTGGEYGG